MVTTSDTYIKTLIAKSHHPRLTCQATDQESLSKWQSELGKALWSLMGMDRIAARYREGLSIQKLGAVKLRDHVREEWTIETELGFHVPFFLLRPHDTPVPCPLVLTPHGHSHKGREVYAGLYPDDPEVKQGERDIALQAVREGYVAIVPQARAFGESRSIDDQRNDRVSSCLNWQLRGLLLGRTLIGERVWDIMRLIDYAATRPEIDIGRVVITGNSGGGTVSLFAAAVDPRIGISVPASCFSTFQDSLGAIEHCACNYIPDVLTIAEMSDIAGLITPRPFLAVHGRFDPIFPLFAAEQAFNKLKQIYKIAGVEEHCQLFIGPEGHRYYKDPVWQFVRHWVEV